MRWVVSIFQGRAVASAAVLGGVCVFASGCERASAPNSAAESRGNAANVPVAEAPSTPSEPTHQAIYVAVEQRFLSEAAGLEGEAAVEVLLKICREASGLTEVKALPGGALAKTTQGFPMMFDIAQMRQNSAR